MIVTATKTVRELALEIPNATRVFERLGIDYCCGGGKSLEEACVAAHLDAQQVQNALAEGSQTEIPDARNWQEEPLADLIQHIHAKHHVYIREAIPRLQALFAKVCAKHGEAHPELSRLRKIFNALGDELIQHLMKEEVILFPYVNRMEESVLQKEPILPPPFGTVENPIHMMETEHDSAGEALRALRTTTNNYTLPAEACMSYQTLFKELQDFEGDLHQHIHLENNVLFPRAAQMEKESGR